MARGCHTIIILPRAKYIVCEATSLRQRRTSFFPVGKHRYNGRGLVEWLGLVALPPIFGRCPKTTSLNEGGEQAWFMQQSNYQCDARASHHNILREQNISCCVSNISHCICNISHSLCEYIAAQPLPPCGAVEFCQNNLLSYKPTKKISLSFDIPRQKVISNLLG